MARDDAVENSTPRDSVLRLIEEQPGLDIQEISKELDLSRSALVYHIRKLGDRVVTIRQGRHLLHFSSTMPSLQRNAIALLRIWSVRHVVEEAVRNQAIQPTVLAELKGISGRSVRRSIRMLVDAGLAQDRHTQKHRRSARRLLLHPHMRIAWSIWCRNAEPDHELKPLHKAPGWLLLLDTTFGWLFHHRALS